MAITHYNKQGKCFSDNFRINKAFLSLKLIYIIMPAGYSLISSSLIEKLVTDQNLIAIGTSTQTH